MKKRLPVIILSLLCSCACAVGLAACGESEHENHSHTYSADWSSNESSHWHDATCGHDEKGGEAAHVDGNNDGECDVCKYTPMTVKVGGTYYFCENDETDDSLYITLKDGKWKDDEDLTGDYVITGNVVTLYIEIDGVKTEFIIGAVRGDDITFDMGGATAVYRKGEDIGDKPKEKTLKYSLSEDKSYYIVNGIGGLTGDIEIPDEYKRKPVKEIAENAFAGCSELTSILIGDNVTTVGKKAFYNCANLTEAVLGESVDCLSESAFEKCKKFEKVTVSASVKSFEYDVFKDCNTLNDIYYTGTASDWAAIEFKYSIGYSSIETANPLYAVYLSSTGEKEIYRKLYIDGEPLTAADLTDATTISPVCFYRYKYLESATIGGTADGIGEYAFYNCANLTSVQFGGSSLKTVGRYSFGNSKISSVTLPDSVERIEKGAFGNCGQLASVNTGAGATYVGYGAFMGCSVLNSLVLGSSVREICESAFYGCYDLKNVTIPSSVIYIGKEAFASSGITSATFQNTDGWMAEKAGGYEPIENLSDTSLAATLLKNSILAHGYADYNWEIPTLQYTLSSDKTYYTVNNNGTLCRSEIEIPETYNGKPVRTLDYGAFSGCTALKSISLPGCMFSIPLDGYNSAFYGCTSLESIEVRGYLVSDYEEVYASDDGVLYNADYTKILFIPPAKTTVTISGINEIPDEMFRNNSDLKKVIIADGVTAIGGYAFSGCTSLTNVVIPDSVTSIGNYAFYNCTSLTSVVIPDSVTIIANDAFSGCTSLTSVTLSNGLTEIGNNAFYNCASLMSITVPKSVTSIGGAAFYGCTSLMSVTLSNGLTEIGGSAFYNCTSLMSITVPKSVTSIGGAAFSDCNCLTVYCEAAEKPGGWDDGWDSRPVVWNCKSNDKADNGYVYAVIGGVRYGLIDGTARVGAQPDNITEIIIPENVMYKGRFYAVTEVTGNYRYGGVYGSLASITYEGDLAGWCAIEGLNHIMQYGVSDKKLIIDGKEITGELVIPDGVKVINEGAFYGCKSLTGITVPKSVTGIVQYAFYGCDNVTSITYEGDLAGWCNIGLRYLTRFCSADGIKLIIDGKEIAGELIIPDGVRSISGGAFYGCKSLTSVVIPEGVTKIAHDTFSGCTSLTSVVIPDSVTSIYSGAFSGCTSLTSVVIPDSVTSIYSGAFSGCTSLTSVTIPESVREIEYEAFYNCASLTSVVIPEGVTKIAHDTFSGCTSLTSVVIPDSVTSIGNYAFRDCMSLTSVVIPEGVTSIGSAAFRGCTSLTSVTIPDSVTKIEEYMFSDCTSLTSVVIPDSVTSISISPFKDCTSLTSVVIPDSVTGIYSSAFSGCTSLTIYCEAESKSWSDDWNRIGDNWYAPVVWDCKNNDKTQYGKAYAVIDGIRYCLNDGNATVAIQPSVLTGAVTIPSSVSYKGDSYEVTVIGQYAFRYCGITSVVIPDSVTKIEYGAFYGCMSLTSIVIPDSVTYTDEALFKNCPNLKSVTLGSGVKSIKKYSFSGCTGLTSVTIKGNITYIDKYAFSECGSLTTITFYGTEEQWNAISKANYWNSGMGEYTVIYKGNEE